jgi:hypothetical protein
MLSPEDPAPTYRNLPACRAATLTGGATLPVSGLTHKKPVSHSGGWFVYRLTAEFSKKILSFRILEGGCVPSVLHHYKML